MSETEMEKNEVRGFAQLINTVILPLNENEKFKEKFATKQVKIVINARNLRYAALIIIDNGTIRAEGIRNEPKENLDKKIVGWDAYFEMDSAVFLMFAMNRISLLGVMKLVIKKEVTLKGLRKLVYLMQVMKILTE